jgi:hypothetical protein
MEKYENIFTALKNARTFLDQTADENALMALERAEKIAMIEICDVDFSGAGSVYQKLTTAMISYVEKQ